MLKSENRLKKNKHFNYIYKHGQYVTSSALTLVYIKTKFRTYKVGFSVNNKIGKANVRNKIKRRLREAFKSILPTIDRRYNYIFIARAEIVDYNFEQIKECMINLIQKASIK